MIEEYFPILKESFKREDEVTEVLESRGGEKKDAIWKNNQQVFYVNVSKKHIF